MLQCNTVNARGPVGSYSPSIKFMLASTGIRIDIEINGLELRVPKYTLDF